MSTFMELNLPSGGSAIIDDLKGKHLFEAMNKSKGMNGDMVMYLIIETCQIEGAPITEDQIKEMPIKDVSYLSTVISTQLQDTIF